MKVKINHLKNNLISIIVMTLVGFILGFFVTEYGVNTFTTNYEINLTSDKNLEEFLSYDFFDSTIKEIDEYNKNNEKKINYAKIDYESMINDLKIEKNNDQYKIIVKAKYFPTIAKKSNGDINYGNNRCFKYFKLILSYSDANIVYNDIKITGLNNSYIFGGIGAIIVFILFASFIMIKGNNKPILNSTISIFNKKYWQKSFGVFKDVKNITLIAMLFALMILCKLIALPSGFGMLGISFTYLFFSIITMLFGPIVGVIIGFCSDMIGYFLFQSSFKIFFGYTLNAMLAGFTYGLCFYKRRITFTKCLYARLVVNLIINVCLGSLWWKILYSLTLEGFYSYLFFIALPKNIVYLLPQSILLYFVLKIIIKPLSQLNLIDKEISKNVTLI